MRISGASAMTSQRGPLWPMVTLMRSTTRSTTGSIAERQQARTADGDAAAAGFVAWEALAVEDQHRRTLGGQTEGCGGARRPRADDDHVEAFTHRRRV